MNKRGIALIFCVLVILVIAVLSSSFFSKVINENNLVNRYINTIRAFWAAEAGIAQAINSLSTCCSLTSCSSNCPGSGSLDSYSSYLAQTSYRATINLIAYYNVSSTGIVNSANGNDIRWTIDAVVQTGAVDSTKFQYGIAAANDLCFGGASCNKDPLSFLDPTVCNGHPCWEEKDTTINFRDLFGYEQSEVEQVATHYTWTSFPGNVSGITWVDVTPGQKLSLTGNQSGSGILIINGDATNSAGTYQFHGIIYVLGTFDAHGTFDSYGSIVVASTAGIDQVNGNPTFHYDQTKISSALNLLSLTEAKIVSWNQAQ